MGIVILGAVTDALKKGNALADLHSDHQPTDSISQAEMRGYNYLIGGEVTLVEVNTQPGWNTVDRTAHVQTPSERQQRRQYRMDRPDRWDSKSINNGKGPHQCHEPGSRWCHTKLHAVNDPEA